MVQRESSLEGFNYILVKYLKILIHWLIISCFVIRDYVLFVQERDADSERIRSLVEENAQLQFDKKMSMNQTTNLDEELQASKAKIAGWCIK